MPPCFHATGHWQLSIEVSVGEGFYPARPITGEFPFPLRRGRCLHRPAAKTYLLSVGATLAVARLPCTTLHAKNCHCEASAHTGCGNPHPPSPWPPCLKGAGTAKPRLGDSSLYHTPCNAFVGAGFYPARGRGRAPPLRTSRYASVGDDAHIVPPHRTPCNPP